MPTDNYELARQIVDAASTDEFVLPEYTGDTKDLAYLKQWTLELVTSIYGVDASLFDSATVVSTSILRDFVHRALYQTTDPNDIDDIIGTDQFAGFGDVAFGFRYPAYGLCGFMAWQMWEVFRAFGYQTNEISTFDSALTDSVEGHVTAEVYVSDLGKYIVQDATFNFLYRDGNGDILSFLETREVNNANATLVFDGFTNYRWYYIGLVQPNIDTNLQAYFREHYIESVYWWYGTDGSQHFYIPNLFPDPTQAHVGTSEQGGTFVDIDTAVTQIIALADAAAQTWTEAAATLRTNSYYVSGFQLRDDQGAVVSQWLTVRLDSGDYVSVNLADASTLSGSFDQLVIEAVGGPVLNPGSDLALFRNAANVLGANGQLMTFGDEFTTATDQFGSASADYLRGGTGVDRIFGYEGNDILHDGGAGTDYLVGGTGDDAYIVNSETVRIIEQVDQGIDTIYVYLDYKLPENIEVLHLMGTAISGTGNSGETWLYGNGLANKLHGTSGVAHMFGGLGNDIYYIDDPHDIVAEYAGEGNDTIITSTSVTLQANSAVEMVQTYGSATTQAIDLTGNDFDNTLVGNSAANAIDGRGGADLMWGYAGDDTYYVDHVGDRVVELTNGGNDTIITSVSVSLDATSEVETLQTYGSSTSQAINLTGSNIVNTLVGNSAPNVIDGRGGADIMWGYAGDDTYYIDDPGDRVVELQAGGNDTIITSVSVTLDATSEVETIKTFGSMTTQVIHLTGSDIANTLVGNAADNNIDGRGGADVMWGYAGNDTYYVDNTGDKVTELVNGGIDTIITRVSLTLDANTEIEILTTYGSATTQSLNLIGNDFANTIVGNAAGNTLGGRGGNDILWSYGGNDRLVGGLGNDTLNGGKGADIFVFDSTPGAGTNVDTIQDFTAGTDLIELDDGIFDALSPGDLPATAFAIASQAQTADQHIVYDATTGALYYDPDGSGAEDMLQFAVLRKGLALTNSDFLIA